MPDCLLSASLQEKTGETIALQRGSLLIDPCRPWLSATPD